MFAALFASFVEFCVFIAIVVGLYQIFVKDWFRAMRAQWKAESSKASNMDKIAQVKLVSTDPKDIEQFVTNNAQYLSDQMVKRLVERIDSLRTDQIIIADEVLKRRIEELPQPEEEEEEYAETIRSQRTSN